MRPVAIATAALLAAAACVPSHGPSMAAGQDCLACHDGGEARQWTLAGTWTRGAQVGVVDAGGKQLTLRGNDVGNFYTREPLAFPVAVTVDGKPMPKQVTYGGCNLCHQGGQVVVGELMAPGRDCLGCHDGTNGTTRFTAAGTWTPGATVTITDGATSVTLTANSVGNFFTSAPFAGPLVPSVNGTTMPDPTSYGGCNRCHGGGGVADR
jgi:hypothetical protein